MPPCLVPLNFLGGEELPKVCFKSVRRTQPDLQTSLVLQYKIAREAIVNELNINELQTILLLQYTIAREAIVNQLIINEDPARRMF